MLRRGSLYIASLAQWFLTRAYEQAPAAQVGPFTYATVVFAAIAGWAVWGEVMDVMSLFGLALVCAAGILAIRRIGRKAVTSPEFPGGKSLRRNISGDPGLCYVFVVYGL